MNRDALRLYAVTDRHWLNGRSLSHDVELSIKGGATMIQLREKNLDEKQFYEEALQIKELCRKYNVPFIINDNVQLAKEIDADGVHVGQSDMECTSARQILGPGKIIGVSAHSVQEAVTAQKNGADYLGVGAVFATGTKNDASVLDHEICKAICGSVNIPCVAIGGISIENISQLKGLGFAGVSVVSAIYAQRDIEKAAGKLFDESCNI